jgi:hypothetical protein
MHLIRRFGLVSKVIALLTSPLFPGWAKGPPLIASVYTDKNTHYTSSAR